MIIILVVPVSNYHGILSIVDPYTYHSMVLMHSYSYTMYQYTASSVRSCMHVTACYYLLLSLDSRPKQKASYYCTSHSLHLYILYELIIVAYFWSACRFLQQALTHWLPFWPLSLTLITQSSHTVKPLHFSWNVQRALGSLKVLQHAWATADMTRLPWYQTVALHTYSYLPNDVSGVLKTRWGVWGPP